MAIRSSDSRKAVRVEFQTKEVYVDSYTTNSDKLINTAKALLKEHPDNGSPQRQLVRTRLESALGKLQDHFQNDSRDLHRAIQKFHEQVK